MYTHPLWFFLLVCLRDIGVQDLFLGVLGLSFVVSCVTVGILLQRAEDWVAVLAVTLLLCSSKSFVEFSSSGLENPLSHLVVLLLFLLGLGVGPDDPFRRGLGLGTLVAALALCRPDLLVLVAPLVCWMLWSARRPMRAGLAFGVIPLVLWELWSLFYYGDIVPNTACAKMNQVIPWALRLQQGESYYLTSLGMDYVTLPVIGLAIVVGIYRGGVFRFGGLGLLLYFAYVASIPGDFMAGRMQSTQYVLAAAILVGCWARRRALLATLAGLVLCGTLANPQGPLPANRVLHKDLEGMIQLADERAWYHDQHHLVFEWNEGLRGFSQSGMGHYPQPWGAVGHPVLVDIPGVKTFVGGLGPHYVDEYALSDPLLSRLPIRAVDSAPRPGHLARQIPKMYIDSLKTGRNQLQDPAVAALWDDVRIATRAPLYDPRRWKAVGGTVLCGRAHRAAVISKASTLIR